MIAYTIGDRIRIKGRCGCGGLPKPAKGAVPALALRESSACWHGPRTIVAMVFQTGDYLLENGGGAVRLARPDQVCR
jgi:hypothetical protein